VSGISAPIANVNIVGDLRRIAAQLAVDGTDVAQFHYFSSVTLKVIARQEGLEALSPYKQNELEIHMLGSGRFC